MYQGAIHHIQTPSFAERASYLEMVARQSGLNAFADQIGQLPLRRSFSVPWANWQSAATHRVILGHDSGVQSVAVGEWDGRAVIVSGGRDGTVRVWDLATGRPVGEPLRGHDGGVWSVAVGERDGRAVIVSGGNDGTVRVWDLATGRPVGEPLRGHDGGVWSVAVGEWDGRAVIVSGGRDGTVRVWDLATDRPVGEPLRGHDGGVSSVAVGERDGRAVIVSGGNDETVRVWDLATGRAVGEPLRGHDYLVRSVALGELDGRAVIVSGGEDGTVRVWDPATGRPVGEPLRGHVGVWSVAVGKWDGRAVIVSGGGDGTVRVWDLATGQPVGEPLRGHDGLVRSVALGELDGRAVIVSGGEDGTVRVWDPATGRPVGEPLRGYGGGVLWDHDGGVWSVAVGERDGRAVVVSGGGGETVRVWDLATGQPVGKPLRGHESVDLWGHGGGVWSVAVGERDGRAVIVSGGGDGTVRVWDLATGQPVGEPLRGHESEDLWGDGGGIWSVAVGERDGRAVIVSGGRDGTVRVWDLATGQPVGEPLRGHESEDLWGHDGDVWSVAVGERDGRAVIVSGGNDGTVRVWDLATGRPVGEPLRGHDGGVWSVAVGERDSRAVIVSGGGDGTVRVWDLATGRAVGEPLWGDGGGVRSVAVGERDGRAVIVSGGNDKTVRVWGASGQLKMTVSVDAAVAAVALAPGERIIVGTSNGLMVLKWNPIAHSPSMPRSIVQRPEP